ncbi:vWA domain-containing protein [Deinococcus sonorensis]|uniref:VWA domain-containing protein n=2 Tax=Deinococcus sonorensis TaxID=309891 RepID=A0AAU7U4J9_9DEIO
MTFVWPWALALLLLLPALWWGYRRALPGQASSAALHPDLRLIAGAAAGGRPLRRHLPAALYLLAVALALVALARPTVRLPLPLPRVAIVLALDLSLSMDAQDIAPSRFAAAQSAARDFVRDLPAGVRVGLVTFGSYAELNAPLTTDHAAVIRIIDALTLGHSTAIGEGLLTSLHALTDGGVAPGPGLASIVLLSDGRSNTGAEPLDAARQVLRRGIQVNSVGLGTQGGLNVPGGFVVGFDAETLHQVATMTGGHYYEARSASQLRSVYRRLARALAWRIEPREVSGLVSALAAVLLLASLALAQGQRRVL